MRGKKYRQTKEQVPAQAVDLATAIAFVKEHARPSFDETIELHVHLGVDPEKSDQAVRGTVQLPAGSPRQQRVVIFTSDSNQQQEVKAAGAAQAGGEELVESIIQSGGLEADSTIATPQMMPKVARAAKILGPRGLMPNPKTGTVSDNPAQTLRQLLGGKVMFKMDQQANIHFAVGKASWSPDKIIANVNACVQAVREARPAAVKGEFIRSLTIKSTMSPAVRVAR